MSMRTIIITGISCFLCVLLFGTASAVHNDLKGTRCLDCHDRLPFNSVVTFSEQAASSCTRCHTALRHSHPIDIAPSMTVVPPDMPLDTKGRLACFTCHTYHNGYKDAEGKKLFFLRRQGGRTFCFSCHKKL
jgi:hypothetical protein